jgi:hypothetical protein
MKFSNMKFSNMNFIKYVNVPVLIITIIVGFFIVNFTSEEMRKIYVYPTPENVDLLQYRDKTGTCFSYKQTSVTCPANSADISKVPAQG